MKEHCNLPSWFFSFGARGDAEGGPETSGWREGTDGGRGGGGEEGGRGEGGEAVEEGIEGVGERKGRGSRGCRDASRRREKELDR